MTRKWQVISALLLLIILFWVWRKEKTSKPANKNLQSDAVSIKEPLWTAPDSNSIPHTDSGELIRYGKKLISSTSRYFGPRGSVNHSTNGMNCQNCHLNAGTKAFGGSFGSVAAVFPRFSERRGSFETINQRITDCFERSMNGTAPDSNSLEMKAMKAYISWVGKTSRKVKNPGVQVLNYWRISKDQLIRKEENNCISRNASFATARKAKENRIHYPAICTRRCGGIIVIIIRRAFIDSRNLRALLKIICLTEAAI